MPAPVLAALVFLAARAAAPAPHAPSPRELGPFLLGQYRTAVEAKLGTPTKEDKDSDGEPLLVYSLAGEMETYLVVSVSEGDFPRVTSIQISGKPKADLKGMGSVNLGDPKSKVVAALGKPDEEKKGDDGDEFVDYADRNYSFVFRGDRLRSIKIVANNDGFPKKEGSEPDLAGFQRALASRDREAILEYMCADFYINTKDDGQVEFKNAAREELNDEESLAARYLYGGAGSVRELLTPTLAKTPAIPIDRWESGAHPVNSISSTGPLYEVVWNFEAGRWRVWEIALTKDEDEDDPGH